MGSIDSLLTIPNDAHVVPDGPNPPGPGACIFNSIVPAIFSNLDGKDIRFRNVVSNGSVVERVDLSRSLVVTPPLRHESISHCAVYPAVVFKHRKAYFARGISHLLQPSLDFVLSIEFS